ncbi:helix-turn-helix transcriptional regulator [Vagococcus coleopterorum]|uniref:Helix-turn-helix transcriptional regulator n=1 Tax=Vagococcus coleopterorum TaxID=2714946 RepID=A0A6G8AP53_9ENTE|nr:helix-turn-helix transcriptional regulator [Vagococcus coleopterorum]QIL46858.1 helix-turn-helix transcriptional regulator [Vagococcus coleopterorum]
MEHNVGKIISDKRKEKGFTQEQLAEELHVTRQAVSNWERNVTVPDRPMVEQLANIIGANIDGYIRVNKKVKGSEEKLNEKKEKEQLDYNDMMPNKYDTAIGLFYGVSLFIGLASSGLMIYFGNFSTVSILLSIGTGLVVFLILGLLIHGIITLVRKDQ